MIIEFFVIKKISFELTVKFYEFHGLRKMIVFCEYFLLQNLKFIKKLKKLANTIEKYNLIIVDSK